MRIKRKLHAICIQILWVYIYIYTSWIKSLILPKVDLPRQGEKGFSKKRSWKRVVARYLPWMQYGYTGYPNVINVHFHDPPGIFVCKHVLTLWAKNSFCSMSFYSYSRNQERIWVRITGIEETYLLNIPSTKIWSLSVSQCLFCLNKFHGPWNVVVL